MARLALGRKMIGKKISAEDGSVAVGGNNNGDIVNVKIESGGVLHLHSGVSAERSLATYLGEVIAVVAQQSLSEYGHSFQRDVSNEVQDKLDFNHITLEDRIVQSYRRYYFMLDRAYKGVEQTNNDARVLVRLRAGSIYDTELTKACKEAGVDGSGRIAFSRKNAHLLMNAVKAQLVRDFNSMRTTPIEPTWVDLAVSLLVADAVAECDVLERAPTHVASA